VHPPHDLERPQRAAEGRLPPLRRQGHRRAPLPWKLEEKFKLGLPVKISLAETVDQMALPTNRVGRLLKFKLSEADAWVRIGVTHQDVSVPRLPTTAGGGRAGGSRGAAR